MMKIFGFLPGNVGRIPLAVVMMPTANVIAPDVFRKASEYL